MLSTQVQAIVQECFAEVGSEFQRQLRRDIIAVRSVSGDVTVSSFMPSRCLNHSRQWIISATGKDAAVDGRRLVMSVIGRDRLT